jgi:hypothetical protein
MVGPKCPVLAAINTVRRSRGSQTTWWMMCPRNIGADSFHVRLIRSLLSANAPFLVPIKRVTAPLSAAGNMFMHGLLK